MMERRKIRDRRVNAPKQGLPLYYTRHIKDRRQTVNSMQWSLGKGLIAQPIVQPDA